MVWLVEELGGRSDLDNLAEVHDSHAVCDMAHDRQIVRNEEIRQLQVFLQVHQQVDHLGPDRNVQSRHWLVQYEYAWIQRERSCNPGSLSLPA